MTVTEATRVSPGEALARWDEMTRRAFPQPMWVAGEVVQVRGSGSHLYLTLGDEASPAGSNGSAGPAGMTVARMTVAALGIDARRIRGRLAGCGLALERGMRVEVYGHLRVWAGTGAAELRAIDIDTRVGVGRAEQDRRRAITVIRRAGLSERQARMGTPLAPLRVAVISPAGQGLEDFRARLDMTAWAWDVRVLVTPSEGADAGERLARAVRAAGSSPDVDVVVVTRGGGSASLDAYDDRAVIMAVADCPRPVIVAVGHHSDRPLAEMVAWRAEATPTAAAVALDRILAAQLSEVAAEAAGLIDDAIGCLSGLAEELEREWGEARLALQRAARPTEPAWPGSPTSRISRAPLRMPLIAVAAVAAVMAVLVAVLLLAGVW